MTDLTVSMNATNLQTARLNGDHRLVLTPASLLTVAAPTLASFFIFHRLNCRCRMATPRPTHSDGKEKHHEQAFRLQQVGQH